ncbi:MAG: carboxypeptidase regulatory-like domain-containing protein, partial [Terracidiphilus sp.]
MKSRKMTMRPLAGKVRDTRCFGHDPATANRPARGNVMRSLHGKALLTALACVLAMSFCVSAFAQMDTGSLTGTVKDPSGAVVVHAKCTLTNTATDVAQTAISTSAGAYTFAAVPAGSYTLRVAAHGFKEYVLRNIRIHVQNIVTADVPLELGSVNQQVTVTSAEPLLQAQDASVGMTINSKMANDLPLQGGGSGRNFLSLAQLAPGVSSTGSPSSTTILAAGVENGQVDVRLNGVDDNLEFYGGTTILPLPDAIQEFKFMDGNNSAEFGHSTGAVINAITYSGTNAFHGHVWEYFQNEDLNANDYFSNLNGKGRTMLRHNEFGGLLGGPVMLPHYNGRDRTFFFVDFQRTMHASPNSYTQTVPTATMQKSGFTDMQDLFSLSSSTHSDALGRKFQYGTIFDPATTRVIPANGIDPVTGLTGKPGAYVRDPFYNCSATAGCPANDNMSGNATLDYTTAPQKALLNILPSGRLDPNAVALLALLPNPDVNTTNPLSNNWYATPNKIFSADQYDARIDEKISDKDSIWGTYSHTNPIASATTAYPGPAEGALSVNYATTNPSYMIVSSWTHVFSPNLINEFRFGVNSNYQTRLDPFAGQLGLPAKFGIPGIPQSSGNGGLPVIHTGVISDYGAHRFAPTIQTARVFAYQDNLTRIVGRHEFKFGGEYNHLMSNIIQPAYPRGWFQWNGEYSDIPNASSGDNGMADMVLTPVAANSYYALNGGISTSSSTMGGLAAFSGSNYSQTNYHAPYAAVYAQDYWKITPVLTATLGLRWDYFGAYASDSGQEANFVMGGNGVIQDGNGVGGYYLIGRDGCNTNLGTNFKTLLASLGIPVVCSSSNAVTKAQKTNFGPHLGIDYRIRPRLVARAGAGIAYGALDSIGYGGTLGTNYPFQFTYSSPSSNTSQIPLQLPGTTTTATMENAFNAVSLTNPTLVNPAGIALTGKNYYYQTPYDISLNFMVQWQFTSHDSIQSGYVGTLGRHLDSPSTSHNNVSEMLPPGTAIQTINQTNPALSTGYLPYNALGSAELQMTNMISSYHSWQTSYERRFADGSSLSASYTLAKCLSDNIGKTGMGDGIRALWLPGMGARADYSLCTVDMQ